MATSPEQAKKINTYKISLHLLMTRKKKLIPMVENLNKIKSIEAIEHKLNTHMGEKNCEKDLLQN